MSKSNRGQEQKAENIYGELKSIAICIVGKEFKDDKIYSNLGDKEREKIQNLLKREFPQLVVDCTENEAYFVALNRHNILSQELMFYVSFGVLPEVAKTKYVLEVYGKNGVLVYKHVDLGRTVSSVFFIPFFFLQNSQTEIQYQQLKGFIENL